MATAAYVEAAFVNYRNTSSVSTLTTAIQGVFSTISASNVAKAVSKYIGYEALRPIIMARQDCHTILENLVMADDDKQLVRQLLIACSTVEEVGAVSSWISSQYSVNQSTADQATITQLQADIQACLQDLDLVGTNYTG